MDIRGTVGTSSQIKSACKDASAADVRGSAARAEAVEELIPPIITQEGNVIENKLLKIKYNRDLITRSSHVVTFNRRKVVNVNTIDDT